MNPQQITTNLQAIQSSITGFDFTALSTEGQAQAYNDLKQLGSLIMTDPNTITSLPTAIMTVATALQTVQNTAQPAQITP